LKAAASHGNPSEPRPSSSPDASPRTTGAPNPVTPGAADAADAAGLGFHEPGTFTPTVGLPDSFQAFFEACGKLAGEAAARGEVTSS